MAAPVFTKLTNRLTSDLRNELQPLADQVTSASLVLGAAPTVSPGKPSAFFGQENADKLATQNGLSLPASALMVPRGGTDWFFGMWFTTGSMLKSAQYEMLLSKGAAAAAGGNDRGIWITERAATGGLRLQMLLKNGGYSLMANQTPTSNSVEPLEPASAYFIGIFQTADKGYVVYLPVGKTLTNVGDTSMRWFTGDSNHGYTKYYFQAKATGTYTMTRTNNIITVQRSSGSASLSAGMSVYLSADETEVNGVYTVLTSSPTSQFTVASPGPDKTFTNPGYAVPQANVILFQNIGMAETASVGDNYCWSGAVSDIFMRHGVFNPAGSMASTLLTGGVPNEAFIRKIADRELDITAIPGTTAYYHNLGDLSVPAIGSNSTTAPTSIAAPSLYPMRGQVIAQPEYIRIDPRPQEWPHATKLGKRTGTIRLTGTTTIGIRHLFATIYSNPECTTVVTSRHVAAYPSSDGTFSATTKEVAMGCDYWVKLESGDNPGVYVVSGPHHVGPVYGIISQSTLNVLFGLTTGTSLSPVDQAVGVFSTLDISGDLTDSGTNFTNQAAWCRATARRIRYAGQVGNGIVGAANKLLNLFNAALGRKVAIGFANFCTSGHAVDNYIHDRKTRRVSIGTLIAGGTATGTWRPVATPYWTGGSNVSYIKPGSAKLYVNKVLVATSDTSGNWVGQGVTGTINKSTCAYSITTTFGGAAEIECTLLINTQAGGQTQKTADETLTCFGDETVSGVTGHTLERLRAAARFGGLTALLFSWENYRASPLSGLSDADAEANTNYLYTQLRARFKDTLGVDLPWIFMGDPRTTTFNDTAEHKARKFTRAYALANAANNTYYVPAALTATMDSNAGPHAGPNIDGGQLVGEVMAHGLAYVEGLAGAVAEEIMPSSVVRVDASTVDIYISKSLNFPNANLVTGAGGEPEGVYFGTTATALLRIDAAAASDTTELLGGYTVSFPAGTTNVVRVKKDTGTIPSGYWNINYGAPFAKFTNSLATMAAQAAIMDNSIFLNTGGFSAPTRPGISVQPTMDPIYCA